MLASTSQPGAACPGRQPFQTVRQLVGARPAEAFEVAGARLAPPEALAHEPEPAVGRASAARARSDASQDPIACEEATQHTRS